jgi:coenzyme F420-reducing hydrogenase delta subunit
MSGAEEITGSGVEAETIMRLLRSGCDRILKSGTQYDTCGRRFHKSCVNVKSHVAESGI